MKKTTEIDEAFIKRVLYTSILLTALGATYFLGYWGYDGVLGWFAGCGISIAMWQAIAWTVKKTFIAGNTNTSKQFGLQYFIGQIILIVILGAIVWFGKGSWQFLVSMLSGVILTPAVVTLKVAGILVNSWINR